MRMIDRLVTCPQTFHYLRKLPEANYRATKRRIAGQLDLARETLDLGCGTGEFATLFRPESYLGIDISQAYLAYARRRLPGYRFVRASGDALPLGDGAVGQVLINGVLHHLDSAFAGSLLSEAERVLAPGGKLLLIEDIEPEQAGWLTRLLHALDAGEHIRPHQRYAELFDGSLRLEAETRYRSGLCHYGLWLLRKP